MKRPVIIRVDWRDLRSIKNAERRKLMCENAGLSLMYQRTGIDRIVMVYDKPRTERKKR